MTNSVILADDHPIVLGGLTQLLDRVPDFTILDTTSSGHRALALIKSVRPDLAVLDVSMPDVGGLDILRSVHELRLPVRVVLLAATLSSRQIGDALTFGTWGLLLKDYAPTALLDCMRAVASGRKWIPDEIRQKAENITRQPEGADIGQLTPREHEISALVCQGLSNRSIAHHLGTTDGTVAIHLHNIYRKLEISSRSALAALYTQARSPSDGTS